VIPYPAVWPATTVCSPELLLMEKSPGPTTVSDRFWVFCEEGSAVLAAIVTVITPGTDVELALIVTVTSMGVPGVGTTEFEG
jgi:hypothetical protein